MFLDACEHVTRITRITRFPKGNALLMGIGGSVIGCGTLLFFWDGSRVTPISPMGFLAATAGAFVLLFFNRLFSGAFGVEAEGDGAIYRGRRRRRRRRLVEDY